MQLEPCLFDVQGISTRRQISEGVREMVLSRDREIQREQRILSAVRDSLLADPRIARLGERPHEHGEVIERQAQAKVAGTAQ